jgi:excisionase family DNA binding protein
MKGRHLKIKYSPIDAASRNDGGAQPDQTSTRRSGDALIAPVAPPENRPRGNNSSGRTAFMSDPKNPRTSREPLHTAAEVAERLNISIRSVRRMIADGRLPIVRLGHLVRVRPEALEALITGSDIR